MRLKPQPAHVRLDQLLSYVMCFSAELIWWVFSQTNSPDLDYEGGVSSRLQMNEADASFPRLSVGT